ncbi:MAG: pyridoxamine 5'-phosphate oxidase family protein [Acidimicrobiales bacterium]|nr:pyridoxamine 5'-phosphate oxidase family protein [Acidimicrobiales bacterium]
MGHSMRRSDREITDSAEIDRLLSGARYATIALVDGDEPYVVTLSCGYDAAQRNLCFHVAPTGRKLDVIASNPKACATIVADLGYKDGACAHPFESVVMTGTVRVLDDPEEIRAGMRVLIGQLESAGDTAAIFARNKLDTDDALERFRMLVFQIEEITAKAGE